MHQYDQTDEPTALAAGGFTDGNPAEGIARTLLRSLWPNMLSSELLAILTAAGIAPDRNNNVQVVQAIQALINLAQISAVTTASSALIGTITSGPYLVIPANSLVLEGGVFNRADYPTLWTYISANYALVADGVAAANPGAFTSGDGATTFRVPNMADLYQRGYNSNAGTRLGADLGALQLDALQNITGSVEVDCLSSGVEGGPGAPNKDSIQEGALSQGSTLNRLGAAAGAGTYTNQGIKFDASQSPDARTAEETRVRGTSWRWIIRAK